MVPEQAATVTASARAGRTSLASGLAGSGAADSAPRSPSQPEARGGPPRVAAGPGPRQEDFRAGIMMVTVRSSVPLSGLEPYSVGSDSLGANGNLKTRKRATC